MPETTIDMTEDETIDVPENMRIWNFAGDPPRDALKPIPGAAGLTSIDAYWLIEKATELWGAWDVGWGYDAEIVTMADPHIFFCTFRFWHMDLASDKKVQGSPIYDMIRWKGERRSGEPYEDEDAPKKLITSCISKALSYLGFGHTIFRGQHDGKYADKPTHSFNVPPRHDQEDMKYPAPSRPNQPGRPVESGSEKSSVLVCNPDGTEPYTPPEEYPNWLEDHVSNPNGQGKMRHYTWRQMTEGSYGGERMGYLEWAKEKVSNDSVRARAQRCLNFCIWKQQQFEEKMDEEQEKDLDERIENSGLSESGIPF